MARPRKLKGSTLEPTLNRALLKSLKFTLVISIFSCALLAPGAGMLLS